MSSGKRFVNLIVWYDQQAADTVEYAPTNLQSEIRSILGELGKRKLEQQ